MFCEVNSLRKGRRDMSFPQSLLRRVKPLVFYLCLSHKQNIVARTSQMPKLTDTESLRCQFDLSGMDPVGWDSFLFLVEQQENTRAGHLGWRPLCPVAKASAAIQHWEEEFWRINSRALSKRGKQLPSQAIQEPLWKAAVHSVLSVAGRTQTPSMSLLSNPTNPLYTAAY